MLFLRLAFFVLCSITIYAGADEAKATPTEHTPHYLYKIISTETWAKSQNQQVVQLSKEDQAFIHFSTEHQLDKIENKYWSHVPEYVILKVDTHQLPGKLVHEANPNGHHKYFHLYDGSIPMKAIMEAKVQKQPQ